MVMCFAPKDYLIGWGEKLDLHKQEMEEKFFMINKRATGTIIKFKKWCKLKICKAYAPTSTYNKEDV